LSAKKMQGARSEKGVGRGEGEVGAARRLPGNTGMGGRQKDREKDGRAKGGRRENVGGE
jgi:hypothetical protein